MSTIGTGYARTTPQMLTQQLYSRLRDIQHDLRVAQEHATTFKQVNRPSDNAAKISSILFLQQSLASRGQYGRNLDHALSMLNNADQALADANDILLEAKTIASSQVGVGSDATTRETQADIVASQIEALVDIANRQYNHVSLFGGNAGAAAQGLVFEEFLGGIRYLGSDQNLAGDVGGINHQPFTSNGVEGFGALSSRVKSQIDLQPQATAATRLNDINGATNEGFRRGVLAVSVNGTQVQVDLTDADTLGDVVTRVNDAIDGVDPAAGSLAIAGEAFDLTANAGHTITIGEIGSGKTAASLGVELSAAGATANGASVSPRLTMQTRLADMTTAVDWAGGLTITQGEVTKTADFSTAQTVQDLVNVIDELELGVRLEIGDDAKGLDLISEVSGLRLSIGENGGTTAEDLGLRTFGRATQLADFRDGLGVTGVEGENDFRISLHNGTSFDVNIDGATNVDEIITAIENAATTAGVTLGADFSVDLAATGNGFTFTDNTAGGNDFVVENLGLSLAGTHLGIVGNAGGGATIQGDDNATVRAESLFTHLIDLRTALRNDDTHGITIAGSRIEEGLENVSRSRAQVGVNAKRVEHQQRRSQDLEVMEQSMLSDLQDADLTEVITRFTQLQTQLQASLQVGAQNMQLSLLDFLR